MRHIEKLEHAQFEANLDVVADAETDTALRVALVLLAGDHLLEGQHPLLGIEATVTLLPITLRHRHNVLQMCVCVCYEGCVVHDVFYEE